MLFAGFTSLVVGAMLEVLVMIVPEAVPALTFTTRGNIEDVPLQKSCPTCRRLAAPGQQLIAARSAHRWKRGANHPAGSPAKQKLYSPAPNS